MEVSRKFQGNIKEVKRKFQGCSKVTRVYQEHLKDTQVSRELQGYFKKVKEILGVPQECFKKV